MRILLRSIFIDREVMFKYKKLFRYINLFLVRGVASFSIILLNYIVTLYKPIDVAGRFFFGFAIFTFFVNVCRLGTDYIIVRDVNVNEKDKTDLINSVVSNLIIITMASLVVVVFYSILSLCYEGILELKMYIFAIPLCVIITYAGFCYNGLGDIEKSIAYINLVIPLFFIFFLVVFDFFGIDYSIDRIFLFSVVVLFFIFFIYENKKNNFIYSLKFVKRNSCIRQINLNKSRYKNLTIAMLIGMSYMQAPFLILGFLNENEIISAFSVCLRMAMIPSFIIVIFNTLLIKDFSFKKLDEESLSIIQIKVKFSRNLCIAISLPILLLLIAFSEYMLSFFGREYLEYERYFIVMMMFQFVYCIWGLSESLLIMLGFESSHRKNVIYVTLFSFLVSVPLYFYNPMLAATLNCLIPFSFIKVMDSFCLKRKLGFGWLNKI